jgi:hypothetical protein
MRWRSDSFPRSPSARGRGTCMQGLSHRKREFCTGNSGLSLCGWIDILNESQPLFARVDFLVCFGCNWGYPVVLSKSCCNEAVEPPGGLLGPAPIQGIKLNLREVGSWFVGSDEAANSAALIPVGNPAENKPLHDPKGKDLSRALVARAFVLVAL